MKNIRKAKLVAKNKLPDVVELEKSDLLSNLEDSTDGILSDGCVVAQVRTSGDFYGKSIWLDSKYNWEIVTDANGVLILLPSLKK